MDEHTFKSYAQAWGKEPKQETKNLSHLNQSEIEMYDALRLNQWGESLRLEQERIAYAAVLQALTEIKKRITKSHRCQGEQHA